MISQKQVVYNRDKLSYLLLPCQKFWDKTSYITAKPYDILEVMWKAFSGNKADSNARPNKA